MSKARQQSESRRAVRQAQGIQKKGASSTKQGTGHGNKRDRKTKSGEVRFSHSNVTISPRRKLIKRIRRLLIRAKK